ncbi:hypothetical protein Q8A64_03135 [Oxalobacteraceae bacterium R-40]|uniref:Uncharacterized protein n=1 Tax=Keguizhuia sedimenti TaxID=3064264 RepID=A0ABU1BK82_9BURK|nr:hypothetical protein [Oxalobacteraceae bacterium R-40]
MKKIITVLAAGFITSAISMFATVPSAAASVDINIGVPTVVTQARPVYVHPQYESDWRERQARAAAWRNNPANHGQVVSTAAHNHAEHKKAGHKKHQHKHHGKHGH